MPQPDDATYGLQRLLTARELSRLTGIPVSTLHHWAQAGKIPHLRLGQFVRFPEREVAEWIAKNTRGVDRDDNGGEAAA